MVHENKQRLSREENTVNVANMSKDQAKEIMHNISKVFNFFFFISFSLGCRAWSLRCGRSRTVQFILFLSSLSCIHTYSLSFIKAVGEMVEENGELEQDRMEGVDPKEWEE